MKSHKYSDQDSTNESTSVTGSSAGYDSTDSVFLWDTHLSTQIDRLSYDSICENEEKPKEPVPNLWDPQSSILCDDFLQQLSPCSLRVTKLKLEYPTPELLKSNAMQDVSLKKSVETLDSDGGSVQCTPTHTRCKKLQERRGSTHSLSLALKAVELSDNLIDQSQDRSPERFLLNARKLLTKESLNEVLSDIPRLHEEFWSIPNNHPEQLEVAGSALKNRYKFVIPNAHSRVKLPNGEAVDPLAEYINANYVRGYNGQCKAYIATQGPMAHTIQDFWKMVLSEKASIIVQITQLEESQQVKCEQYVPINCKVASYGGVTVCVESEERKVGYTVRRLLVKKDGEDHRILHFWYTEWPDHKIPDNPSSLVNLAIEVENARSGGAFLNSIASQLKEKILQSGDVHWNSMTKREVTRFGVKSFSFDDARLRGDDSKENLPVLTRIPRSAPPESKSEESGQCGPVIVHCSAGVGRTGCFLALCLGIQQLVEEQAVDVLGVVCALRHDRGGMVQTAEQYEFIHRGLHLFIIAYESLKGDR